jgi:hypothetical protein
MFSALAVLGLGATSLWAGDTVQLHFRGGVNPEKTFTLEGRDADPDADVVDTHFRFRGYYGGYRGYYGGYRGYYGGYYPRYSYGFSFSYYPRYSYYSYYPRYSYYRSYYNYGYGNYGYGNYGYGYGYPGSYYSYYTPAYYCPIDGTLAPSYSLEYSVPSTTLPPTPTTPPVERPMPKADEQTFPYDGGPRSPVPMPTPDAAPKPAPNKVPVEGTPVSLPDSRAGFTYPAYGEDLVPSAPARDNTFLIRAQQRR